MGRTAKTLEQHRLDGTFVPCRHAHLLESANSVNAKPDTRRKAACGSPNKWIRGISDERAVAAGCWFDERLANYAVNWFPKHLAHSKGEWNGKPFELMKWQAEDIIAPLFGWVRPGETRRFRRTYIEIPKKNGKSTLASGIGLLMLAGDNEPAAHCFSAATAKDQASIVHAEAIAMVESSEALKDILKINYSTRQISHKASKSFYRAISS